MLYCVIITPEAESDLRAAYRYIRRHAPRSAHQWIRRVRQGVKTLSHHPERCPLAQESTSFDEPIRELLFGAGNRGTYRIIFVLIDRSVYVLHVRHGSMLPLDPEQLK
jgi:plasmid stabilization system protein ParE